MITLKAWWSPCRNCTPGDDNSNLINTENAVPIIPAKIAKIKYNVPISLALVENNHLVIVINMNNYFSSTPLIIPLKH